MLKKINTHIIYILLFSLFILFILPTSQGEDSLGESLYDNHCSDCHSLNLRGSWFIFTWKRIYNEMGRTWSK